MTRDPVQVDLEEYIAERGGRPFTPQQQRQQQRVDEKLTTIGTMYGPLKQVLMQAYQQAAAGKGMERHANDKPFTEQPMMEIGRMVGVGFTTGQAIKKAQEAGGMIQRGHYAAAQAEVLGAINYLAGAYLLIGELSVGSDVDGSDRL